MYIILLSITVTGQILVSHALPDIRLPPMITRNPRKDIVFKDSGRVDLACTATGTPTPTIQWIKDNLTIEQDRRRTQYPNGSLAIQPATAYFDDGEYQCKAVNKYGTALSSKARVKQAKIGYDSPSTVTMKTIQEGQALKLEPASKIISYPEPVFNWKTVHDLEQNTDPRELTPSQRVALDPLTGALYFANVIMSDAQDGRTYKLDVRNAIEDVTKGGSPYRIFVNSNPNAQNSKPVRMTPEREEQVVVGIKGKNATLKCFFSGLPTPSVIWVPVTNGPPQHRLTNCPAAFGTECHIRDLEYSDENDYTCKGFNSEGEISTKFVLRIESEPTFIERPQNQNVTTGSTVTFRCKADAKPEASIEWFTNGNLINPDNPGNSKFKIYDNRQTLMVDRVCKVCDGAQKSDIQVFQCRISNKHGDNYASAYLNVLDATTIYETGPVQVELDREDEVTGMTANFTCKANTDPLVADKMQIKWLFNDGKNDRHIYHGQGPFFMKDNNQILEIRLNNLTEKEMQRWLGKYKCVAEVAEPSSSDERTFVLAIKGLEPTQAPNIATIAELWWVFLIILLVLLLFICCITCVLYVQRNKGEEYPVDEKERENGNDPIAELEEEDFHDYQRPIESATLKKGSRASLGSTQRLDSEDDLSMFTDPGRFDEDGSFVDRYGTASSRKQLIVPKHSVNDI